MAFCRFCGSKLSDDSRFCSTCGKEVLNQPSQQSSEEKQEPRYEEPRYEQGYDRYGYTYSGTQTQCNPKPKGVYGLGKAISSVIFATIAAIFVVIAAESFFFSMCFGYDFYEFYEDMAATMIALSIISLPFAIVSTVQGAKSIGNFKYALKTWNSKPIATLILGIVGLEGGVTALFSAVSFFFSGCAFMAV